MGKAKQQLPIVGASVHFYSDLLPTVGSGGKGSGYNSQGTGPYAATVTQVFPEQGVVNLKIMPPFGAPFDVGSVHEKPERGPPGPQYWVWPEAGG